MNLDSGFLILYDWLPLFGALNNKEYRQLMDALIKRQRENAPLPAFKSPIVNSIAHTIEAVIERRLEGAAWAKKGLEKSDSPEDTPEGAPAGSPATKEKEKRSKENLSKDDLRKEEGIPPAAAAAPLASRALSEQDRKILMSEGLPLSYIEEREDRAFQFAEKCGRTAFSLLLEWWKQDRPSTALQKKNTRATPQPNPSSFDVEDFWNAAIEASRRRFAEENGTKSAENPETV